MSFEKNFENHKSYIIKYLLSKMNIKSLDNLSDYDKIRLTKDYLICIFSECNELLNELPWKNWKNYDNFKLNEENIKYEIIDLQHFVNDLYMIWGMDINEINKYFEIKLNENINRQENNY